MKQAPMARAEKHPLSARRKTRRSKLRLYDKGVDRDIAVAKNYAPHPFTNSTKLRSAIPDGPFAIHGFCSSIHAVPAMSR